MCMYVCCLYCAMALQCIILWLSYMVHTNAFLVRYSLFIESIGIMIIQQTFFFFCSIRSWCRCFWNKLPFKCYIHIKRLVWRTLIEYQTESGFSFFLAFGYLTIYIYICINTIYNRYVMCFENDCFVILRAQY